MTTKPAEKWPFIEGESNQPIHENRFYAFAEAGGFYPSNLDWRGHATREECMAATRQDLIDDWEPGLVNANLDLPSPQNKWISTDPQDLGGVMACVLSGREFVDRIYYLVGEGNADLSDFGEWSKS